MGAVQQAIASYGAAAGGPTYATWNPADKDASITVSGGNLTASMTPTVSLVRSTISKSSGKWYWEYVVGVTVVGPIVGVATSAEATSQYPGGGFFSVGYYGPNGSTYKNGAIQATNATYAVGDVVGVAMDVDTSLVTFYKNNVVQGSVAISGTIFAAVGQSGANNPTVTANFGATALTYSPPAGFNAGLYV